MALSMTGYGIDMFHIEDTAITVEIRSVNSRYLDFIPKIPRTLHDLEIEIKDVIKRYFHRGRIEVYISIAGNYLMKKSLYIDWDLMDQFMDQCTKVKDRYHLKDDIPFSVITSMEDLFTVQELKTESSSLKPLLLQSIERVCKQVLSSRKSEGAFLSKDISNRIIKLENMLESIDERKEEVAIHYRERIKKRIEQYVGEMIDFDQAHLLQEIGLLAEKGDISEEIIRLQSHCHHFKVISEQQHPIGRKLDFITQEMHREVNTIGSKSVDSKISEWVVSMKSEIDKIKEQIQNIE